MTEVVSSDVEPLPATTGATEDVTLDTADEEADGGDLKSVEPEVTTEVRFFKKLKCTYMLVKILF